MPYRNPGGMDDDFVLDEGLTEDQLNTLPDSAKRDKVMVCKRCGKRIAVSGMMVCAECFRVQNTLI
ncbi:MAG: hypothetical protein K0R75_3270 [Paenibacillaceae bacterium]|nr:hypothetical protein [Paenibacillaceae bacterium]